MMLRTLLCGMLVVCAAQTVASERDSLSTAQRYNERTALNRRIFCAPYANPALQVFRYNSSLSAIDLFVDSRTRPEAVVQETGKSHHAFGADAEMYIRLKDRSVMWGKAGYRNQRTHSVHWNESADYEWIYPYLTADTIGGNMKGEDYHFQAGYGIQSGKWSYGASFGYVSRLSYRDIDPRPRNNVARIGAQLGGSMAINGAYRLGVSASALRYKQSGSIAYYNELGVAKTYHLTGLGNTYVRFDGTNRNVSYEGHEWGAALQYFPTNYNGLSLSAAYTQTTLTKRLTSINNLPLNKLQHRTIETEMAYLRSERWGIRYQGKLLRHDGDDNIFGEATDNVYPQIATTRNYKATAHHHRLTGFYRLPVATWQYTVQPSMTYLRRNEQHLATKNQIEYTKLQWALTAEAEKQWKDKRLLLCVHGGYAPRQEGTYRIESTALPYAQSILRHNYAVATASQTQLGAEATLTTPFASQFLLHLRAEYSYMYYGTGLRSNYFGVSIGVKI